MRPNPPSIRRLVASREGIPMNLARAARPTKLRLIIAAALAVATVSGPVQPGCLRPPRRFARLPLEWREQAGDRASPRRLGGCLQLEPGHPPAARRRLHRARAAQPAPRIAPGFCLPAQLPHSER